MNVCIYGAGAIGGCLAVPLAEAGLDVSLVARGPHLEAIRTDGLTLLQEDDKRCAHIRATDRPAELGAQDMVIVTLKAHSIPAVVDGILDLVGEQTAVVSAVNGIPWWYFHALDSPWGERHVESVDPGGVLWRRIGPERALGCVVYPAAEIVSPGVVRHTEGNKLVLGEPDGSSSDRARALATAFRDAGFKAPVRPRVRDEIWMKLWGNLAFNPLSALTGATLDVLATNEDTRTIAKSMMDEGRAVGEAFGARFSISVERRLAGVANVGSHRTSMLQDLDLGRPLEHEAMLGAVQELATLASIATPTIDLMHALLRQRIASRDAGG